MAGRHLYVPPSDPAAEPVCLLTREWAARREVPVDALLSRPLTERATPDGIEYRLPAPTAECSCEGPTSHETRPRIPANCSRMEDRKPAEYPAESVAV